MHNNCLLAGALFAVAACKRIAESRQTLVGASTSGVRRASNFRTFFFGTEWLPRCGPSDLPSLVMHAAFSEFLFRSFFLRAIGFIQLVLIGNTRFSCSKGSAKLPRTRLADFSRDRPTLVEAGLGILHVFLHNPSHSNVAD